jgi:hypothetical protein
VAFIGGWIEQFGTFFENETAINIGIVCSLIMPAEALWRMAAGEIQSTLAQLTSSFTSPFSLGAAPSSLFVGYSIFYIFVAVALAIRRFAQRDL